MAKLFFVAIKVYNYFMKEEKKEESYLDSFKEYQDKMYMPGYYVGGKIHPALKAKTKAGGYLLIVTGIFLLAFYLFQLLKNFSFENIGLIMPIAFAILLIVVGYKFIKINVHKK